MNLRKELQELQALVKEVVCTEPPDEGMILLTNEGKTHVEWHNGKPICVYDYDYFSPLGDKMMRIHEKIKKLIELFPEETQPHDPPL